MERFWQKVDYWTDPEGCWPWTAHRGRNGYGGFFYMGRNAYAHRVAREIAGGEIPPGHEVHHRCRNRACVKPDHLMVVTPAEHKRLEGNALKAHCPKGHPYDEHNTYVRKSGIRQCRTCSREQMRARRISTTKEYA